MFLVALAMADQQLDPAEQAALERIAVRMGFGVARLEQLLRMARARSISTAGTAMPPSPAPASKMPMRRWVWRRGCPTGS